MPVYLLFTAVTQFAAPATTAAAATSVISDFCPLLCLLLWVVALAGSYFSSVSFFGWH